MKYNFVSVGMLLIFFASCKPSTTSHTLSQLEFGEGESASLNIFGRVVVGNQNQMVRFQTGVVPIPFVQTLKGIRNLDSLREESFSEHAGRGLAGYLRARSQNLSDLNNELQRYEDISLTDLKRSRRLRTAQAQFPTFVDFKKRGFDKAIFVEETPTNSERSDAIFYSMKSEEAKTLTKALGRPMRGPSLLNSSTLIENYK